MIKYFTVFLIFIFIVSCGYPAIDNVPDFKDTKLTDEEILDYCSSLFFEDSLLVFCYFRLRMQLTSGDV